MPSIVLATLNAKYLHASLGLRSLLANMGALRGETTLAEFTINDRAADIVERLLAHSPSVVGFGVYIWNVVETERVLAVLKAVAPEIRVVLGGPEVSHEPNDQPICALADHVIAGPGEILFPDLCLALRAGEARPHLLGPVEPELGALALPYDEYTDDDLAHRLIYVEASRGCPFKCEFCLSALDRTATPFPQDRFLAAMARLYDRGARHFKFVDRTFNLNVSASLAILEFFRARLDERLFLHFELIPDHLPPRLMDAIGAFPPGSLQFEIGIQTWNPAVEAAISRRQDHARAESNLRWLREHSTAHLHVDLIVGLPGEDLASFGRGFDRLIALDPHEIQIGMLKRLRGAPIARHTDAFQIRYSPHPPYTVLSTSHLDFGTLQRLGRFARYWDLVGNSGRFVRTRAALLADRPFEHFLAFTDWLFACTGQTHQLSVDRLFELIGEHLVSARGLDEAHIARTLAADYIASGQRGRPEFLRRAGIAVSEPHPSRTATGTSRQSRHRMGAQPVAPSSEP